MKIFTLSLLFYVRLEFQTTNANLFSCWSSNSCKATKVQIFPESSSVHNPLYLIGHPRAYKLAIPEPIPEVTETDTADDTNDEDEEDYTKKKNQPVDIQIRYNDSEELITACPTTSKENTSTLFGTVVDTTNNEILEEKCDENKQPKPRVKTLNKTCYKSTSETFTQYEVGYEVFMQHKISEWMKFLPSNWKKKLDYKWYPLYTVCYSHKTRTTIYVVHKIHGVSMSIRSSRFTGNFVDFKPFEKQPKGTADSQTNEETLTTMYTKDYCKNLFESMFGKGSDYIILKNSQNYLAKGHLVADADMIFIPWKITTYFYINVVPMWQEINNGVWKSVEKTVRNVAKKLKRDLEIYTGTFGILTYNKEEIFLNKKKTILPIPAYLWKIAHDKQTKSAIVFVVQNDPYNEMTYDIGQNIENICDKYQWTAKKKSGTKPPKKIHCYEVSALRKTIAYVPNLGNVKPMCNPIPEIQC